jgi:hypothetical protein
VDLSLAEPVASLYLDLLKRCLVRSITEGPAHVPLSKLGVSSSAELMAHPQLGSWILSGKAEVLLRERRGAVETTIRGRYDAELRRVGRDWPFDAETMIGLERLTNVQWCVSEALRQDIPGDLVETGVWRGGATILMRGVLKAYGDETRRVWACDSFEGLPKPDPQKYPADRGLDFTMFEELAVPLEQVQSNFARYGLLDDRVVFVKGWFKDTLPTAEVKAISVLRLDGDLYESTRDALSALYDKLSVGGYVIVDDYNDIAACKAAVQDFRAARGITDTVVPIDWTGVYWQRTG